MSVWSMVTLGLFLWLGSGVAMLRYVLRKRREEDEPNAPSRSSTVGDDQGDD